MNGKIRKTLVIGVIFLFIGVGIQSCIAVEQKEAMKTTTIEQDETWYLANFTMDFGENITNNRIEYEEITTRSAGDWTLNVKINFRCPENLKIIIKYEYFAWIEIADQGHDIIFCDIEDIVTIINGSNPPDINKDYTQNVFDAWRKYWNLYLEISANFTAYEYIDGEWVLTHSDEIYNLTQDVVFFNRARIYERTQVLMRLFERFPSLFPFLRQLQEMVEVFRI